MSNEEIIAENTLVAEFMETRSALVPDMFFGYNGCLFSPENLRYKLEWNWLMPVVEKIESLNDNEGDFDCHFEILRDACFIVAWHGETIIEIYATSKIEAVWLACLEFIKWYNDQPK